MDLGFDVLLKGNNLARLLSGLGVALRISFISIILSLILGLFIGIFMTTNNKVIKFITRLHLEIVRIMPQLVLLFIIFFGFPDFFGLNFSSELASVIVFTFWGSIEMADLVRGSIESIPKHQSESAFALGFNKLESYFYIIIPQAIRRLIPQAINLVTRIIKTTSITLMIGVVETIKVGQQIIDANRMSSPNSAFGIYLVIFLLYFVVCFPISKLAGYLERKWA